MREVRASCWKKVLEQGATGGAGAGAGAGTAAGIATVVVAAGGSAPAVDLTFAVTV